jgi:hypothetical protein
MAVVSDFGKAVRCVSLRLDREEVQKEETVKSKVSRHSPRARLRSSVETE